MSDSAQVPWARPPYYVASARSDNRVFDARRVGTELRATRGAVRKADVETALDAVLGYHIWHVV